MAKPPITNSDTVERLATHQVTTEETVPHSDASTANDLFPQQPDSAVPPTASAGGGAAQENAPNKSTQTQVPRQTGAEDEEEVWNGRYSFKNFIGRALFRVLLTAAWIALAIYTWGYEHHQGSLPIVTIILGIALLLYWLYLGWQIIRARLGHYYELTTKRLFVSTGIFQRRRDQVELLRVNDVYIKQPGPFYRLFDVGTVVVESSEEKLPISYLAGIDNPHEIMDLVWHHARHERDLHSVKVDQV